MDQPSARFTLTVATSLNGLIARATDDAPQNWASPEEQVLFFRDVEAADWAIMGRNTHLAADRPERRRIIFSSRTKGWQRPTQFWCDPKALTPHDLVEQVRHVRPMQIGLILGGTRVHDWFLEHDAIHRVHLTIEPVTFVNGLPVFTNQNGSDPVSIFTDRGFRILSQTTLNDIGTEYVELVS